MSEEKLFNLIASNPPMTFREMTKAMGWTSNTSVRYHIANLIKKGKLTKSRKSRSVRVVLTTTAITMPYNYFFPYSDCGYGGTYPY